MVEGTAIGSPSSPAHDAITIGDENFPFGAGTYELQFTFDSDPLFSDGLDHFTAGYLDSQFGPFGADAIHVDGMNEGDFESGTDGWEFSRREPFGPFIAAEALDNLDPVSDTTDCPLLEAGNQYVLVTADLTAPDNPHPDDQHEELISNPIFVGGSEGLGFGIVWSAFADNTFMAGVGYRRAVHYYPWTCPTTGVVGWTIEMAGPGGYAFTDPARCDRFVQDFSGYVPSGVDSIRLAIDIRVYCTEFSGTESCLDPESRNQTPYLDDIQLFSVPLTVAVDPPAAAPLHTRLLPITPNPFNPRTTVRYEVATDTNVRLQVFELDGNLVTTLLDALRPAGQHAAEWDGLTDAGLQASSGVYWVRMNTSSGVSSSTRIVLLK